MFQIRFYRGESITWFMFFLTIGVLGSCFSSFHLKAFYRSPFKKTNRALNCCLVSIQTAVYSELLFLWPAMTLIWKWTVPQTSPAMTFLVETWVWFQRLQKFQRNITSSSQFTHFITNCLLKLGFVSNRKHYRCATYTYLFIVLYVLYKHLSVSTHIHS